MGKKIYTIKFDANGGSGAPSSRSKTHGVPITLSTTKPTRSGYTFLGWSKSSTAKTASYYPSSQFNENGNMTLYAVWKINSYTVSYNANGGSGAPGKQTKAYGQTLTLRSEKPSRSGYTFKGWATTSTAKTPTYYPSSPFRENRNVTLYAVWEKAKYTISYNANGGSGTPASQTKTHGDAICLSSKKPTRTGYTFLGWSKSSSATSATYGPSAVFTDNANTTLYAVWKVISYTVSYSANGGSWAPAKQTKAYNQTLTLRSEKPSRTGYTFKGWATTSTAKTPNYYPSSPFRENRNVTLYAVWDRVKYTVSYSANGGSGAPPSQSKIYGTSLILSSMRPTRTNYTFKGWATTSTATTPTYYPSSPFNENRNVTLYAVWDRVKYTVSYNANGGTGAPASQIKYAGSDLKLSTTVPTRPGYRFKGWANDINSTLVAYQPAAIYRENRSLTLYALWEKTTYTISYNANGGTGAPASQTKQHNSALTLSSTKPTRNGYKFKGWSKSSTSSTVSYAPSATFTENANTTLYAVWEKISYLDVTYSGYKTNEPLWYNCNGHATEGSTAQSNYFTFVNGKLCYIINVSSSSKFTITSNNESKIKFYNLSTGKFEKSLTIEPSSNAITKIAVSITDAFSEVTYDDYSIYNIKISNSSTVKNINLYQIQPKINGSTREEFSFNHKGALSDVPAEVSQYIFGFKGATNGIKVNKVTKGSSSTSYIAYEVIKNETGFNVSFNKFTVTNTGLDFGISVINSLGMYLTNNSNGYIAKCMTYAYTQNGSDYFIAINSSDPKDPILDTASWSVKKIITNTVNLGPFQQVKVVKIGFGELVSAVVNPFFDQFSDSDKANITAYKKEEAIQIQGDGRLSTKGENIRLTSSSEIPIYDITFNIVSNSGKSTTFNHNE